MLCSVLQCCVGAVNALLVLYLSEFLLLSIVVCWYCCCSVDVVPKCSPVAVYSAVLVL